MSGDGDASLAQRIGMSMFATLDPDEIAAVSVLRKSGRLAPFIAAVLKLAQDIEDVAGRMAVGASEVEQDDLRAGLERTLRPASTH
jgi:hypothetical protein